MALQEKRDLDPKLMWYTKTKRWENLKFACQVKHLCHLGFGFYWLVLVSLICLLITDWKIWILWITHCKDSDAILVGISLTVDHLELETAWFYGFLKLNLWKVQVHLIDGSQLSNSLCEFYEGLFLRLYCSASNIGIGLVFRPVFHETTPLKSIISASKNTYILSKKTMCILHFLNFLA